MEYYIKWSSIVVGFAITALSLVWYRRERKIEPLIGILSGLGGLIWAIWSLYKVEPSPKIEIPDGKIKIEFKDTLLDVVRDEIKQAVLISTVNKPMGNLTVDNQPNSKPAPNTLPTNSSSNGSTITDATGNSKLSGYNSTLTLKQGDISQDFRTGIQVKIYEINLQTNSVSYGFIFPDNLSNARIQSIPSENNAGIILLENQRYKFEFDDMREISSVPSVNFSLYQIN